MNRIHTFMAVVVISISALGQTSMALAGREGSISSIRNQFQADLVKVQGSLSCAMAAENNGQPCTLKIKEDNTGRIFELSNTSQLMRFYQDGVRNVMIEGAPNANRRAATSLSVIRVTAL